MPAEHYDATGDCNPRGEDGLRTLLIFCPACNMYKLPDNKDILHEQYQSGFPLIPTAVCRKCCIISEQVEAIEFLSGQIHELTNTLEKWRNIRSLEKEIDVSYSHIDTTADDGNLLNTSDYYETEPISNKIDGNTATCHEPDPPHKTKE